MSDRLENRTARLTAQAITSGYDGTPVLSDVSLAVAPGKMTVLVGPNGSGKSTLLKTMGRILTPTSGSVLLDGKSIHTAKSRDVARTLGLLPQGPIAPEGLTVRELVAQGRFPHQGLMRQWTRDDEEIVTSAMATASVSEFADRPVDSLSGGQRQRCWIAMALAQQTDLLLLDEPTTFLDLKVQVDLMELLADLAHTGGRTLVVVLHELSLAAAYADHLVMMKEGKIVCAGAPDAIFTAQRLKDVFDLDAHVVRDAETGHLVCVPLGAHARRKASVRVA
ncbi:ABC transporter ATP-binding protein [Pelagibacterium sp. 26DY04]|uniref:ABC transporter ATP-binding protein n=1 Tax=unclassified Pelagibacterium TaxID=2623280 RepID=UPI0028167C97|nr:MULTISPECIES: ABC transporter ATP-binding protein [unclassified Pelagibacterium]WMT87149.1 ABC transporter ATP-binding protein [Pelagibacterium sp. 26DY04]WMT92133.1 ABC transporter ATP-binding protein [Pelagibacterium sp. H642]